MYVYRIDINPEYQNSLTAIPAARYVFPSSEIFSVKIFRVCIIQA